MDEHAADGTGESVMSEKGWHKLNELDQMLRRAKPSGMFDGVKVTIEMINGFELFNTRPYHNYETWSDGYRISDGRIRVQREDLDDAIKAFVSALENPKPWDLIDPEERKQALEAQRAKQ